LYNLRNENGFIQCAVFSNILCYMLIPLEANTVLKTHDVN